MYMHNSVHIDSSVRVTCAHTCTHARTQGGYTPCHPHPPAACSWRVRGGKGLPTCMPACGHLWMHTCMDTCTGVHACACTCTHTRVRAHSASLSMHVHVCMCACTCLHVHGHVHMCTCICVCTPVHSASLSTHVCAHICVHM